MPFVDEGDEVVIADPTFHGLMPNSTRNAWVKTDQSESERL